MSKEIRVRAWDKKDKCYVRVDSIQFDFHGNIEVVWVDCEEHHHDHYILGADEVILEQSTGLKDKNGKEIYEGDLVSSHNGDVLSEIVQRTNGEYIMHHIGVYGGGCLLFPELNFVEVIGTIHENPELLKGEENAVSAI